MKIFNGLVNDRERFLKAIDELNINCPMYAIERVSRSFSEVIHHISPDDNINSLHKVMEKCFSRIPDGDIDMAIETQNGCLHINCMGADKRYCNFHIAKLTVKGESAASACDRKYEEYEPMPWWFKDFHDYNFAGYKKIFKRFNKEQK